MFTAQLTPAILMSLALAAGACGAANPSAGADDTTTASATAAPVDGSSLSASASALPVSIDAALATYPMADLSTAEIAGLVYMREEEKLAHDVYVTLYDQWGLDVFMTISRAETTHMSWVDTLLVRYGIDDPAAGFAVGEFADAALQSLYDDLVARGSVSEIEALRVGAFTEELDIDDLQARASSIPDIALVYTDLEQGSRHHLRAFARQLERRGVDYEPLVLDSDAYDAIISSDTERGCMLADGSMSGAGHMGGHDGDNGGGNGGGNGRRND